MGEVRPQAPISSQTQLALDLIRKGASDDLARAVRALQETPAAERAEAAALLAVLAGLGVGMAQDWDAALDHLQAAAVAGSESARGQLGAMASDDAVLAAGAEADPEIWRALRASITAAAWTAPCEKKVLSQSPRVVAIEGFLSRRVCDWIIARGADRLAPARVHDGGDAAGRIDLGRTNSAFEIDFDHLDLVILMVRTRISATIGLPAAAFESPQILHYAAGQSFALHHDYLDPDKAAPAANIAAFGQRIVTFLTYLNADFEGGETDFPRIGLRHRAGAGDALYFGNVEPSGAVDPRTLHAGLPPKLGEKWLLSQWIRNRARV